MASNERSGREWFIRCRAAYQSEEKNVKGTVMDLCLLCSYVFARQVSGSLINCGRKHSEVWS